MKILILILFLLCSLYSFSQKNYITRGSEQGEVYVSNGWFADVTSPRYAIFYSNDNGEHITPKYSSLDFPPPNEMPVGKIVSDANPGTLYNYDDRIGERNEFWVSFDYGESWEYRGEHSLHTNYISGVSPGTVYKLHSGWQKSIDYGASFELITDSLNSWFREIGFNDSELYGINYDDIENEYSIIHSLDDGNTCIQIPIDSTVEIATIYGRWPSIHRGADHNDLYLFTYWIDDRYHIYHSSDGGYNWTHQYAETDNDTDGGWFTAGNQPGTCYVKRSRFSPGNDHMWLYIDYSTDYGQTFTTYFHDLVPDFTGINPTEIQHVKLNCYPNPTSSQITFEFRNKDAILSCYDVNGRLVYKSSIEDNYTMDVSTWRPGMYMAVIACEGNAGTSVFVVE